MKLATLIVDAKSRFCEELERRGYTVNFYEISYPTSKKTQKLKSMRSRKLKLKGDLSTPTKEMAVEEHQDQDPQRSSLLNIPSY